MKTQKILIIFVFLAAHSYAQQGWFVQNSGTTQGVNTIYFLNYNLGFAGCNGGLLLKTVNGGNTWGTLHIFNSDIKRMKFFDHLTGLVFSNDGIFRTTNGGIDWIYLNSTNGILDFSYSNQYNMMASYSDGTILRSEDGGAHWGLIYPLLSISPSVWSMESYSGFAAISNVIGNTSYHSIYRTTNSGSQWHLFHQVTTEPGSGKTGDLLFVTPDTGYYSLKTGNINYICNYNGNTWILRQVSSFQNSLYFSNSRSGWSAGEAGTIYKTTNAGNNWLLNYTPNTENLNSIQFVNDLTGWAGGENGLIMKTTTAGMTPILGIGNSVPEVYSLSQNYPNPFNPVTRIKFSIPHLEVAFMRPVQLMVYDALGKEVAILVNQQLEPGTYEADWDASEYPSGVYYYQLQSGSFTETKKMVLVK
jgi:photosystem II stability/assembly factor-like uncharacterized protein